MKGPKLNEVKVTNLKKELALRKDLMKHYMVEWGRKIFHYVKWMDQ